MKPPTPNEFKQLYFSSDEISGVTVNEKVVIEDNRMTTRIRLAGCTFQDIEIRYIKRPSVTFENCRGGEMKLLILPGTESIQVNNCVFDRLLLFSEDDSLVVGDLTVDSSEIGEIVITTATNRLSLVKGDLKSIHMGIRERRIQINDLKIDRTCTDAVTLENIQNINTHIMQVNSQPVNEEGLKGAFYLFLDRVDSTVADLSDLHEPHLRLDNTTLGTLRFKNLTSVLFKLAASAIKEVELTNIRNFKEVELSQGGDYDFELKDGAVTTCEKLCLHNFTLKGILGFNDFVFDQISIMNFRNNGSFYLDNCQVRQALEITDSSLGKTDLRRCFVPAKCFRLLDTHLGDMSFTNFNWHNYKLNEKRDPVKHTDIGRFMVSLREAYRQLKNSYEKQGNKIEALEFQRHEMRIHYDIVKTVKANSLKDAGNFLIVGTNKWFSEFGLNIWKPLFFLVAVHLVLLNFLIAATPELGISASLISPTVDATQRGIALYFETLLPTHAGKVKSLAAGSEVSIAGFWDTCIRILSGYFIFYFISASRKYHR